jgi:hypothetical protein
MSLDECDTKGNQIMIAYKYEYKDRQTPGTITVIPAKPEHTEQIQSLAGVAYGVDAELEQEWFGADQYRSRIVHFSEGQFIALDDATGEVVGMTSGMLFQHNPETTFLENWDRTTAYG